MEQGHHNAYLYLRIRLLRQMFFFFYFLFESPGFNNTN